VVIDNLNLMGVTIAHYEAQTKLIVDSNAVLTLPVSRQRLQTVPWGFIKIRKSLG
jgi:hypothetical protein